MTNNPLPGMYFSLLMLFAFVFPTNVQSQIDDVFFDDNKDMVYEGKKPHTIQTNVYINVKDTGDVIHTIPTQTSYYQGLTWDGNYLWCSEILLGKIHQIDPESGTIMKTFSAPGTMIEGLAWDGAYLWAMENGNGPNQPSAIFKIDPNDGTVVDSFTPFGIWLHGITFDGQYLWMVDFSENLIYKVNPETGDVVYTINTPGEGSVGLTWDGFHLWTDDIDTHKLYCLNPSDGSVIYEVNSPHPNPRDLTWDGQFLWVMASQSNLIYQVDVGLINSNFEAGVTTENKYTFSVSPNPFSKEITVSYSLKQDDNIKLQIYNSRGSLVRKIVNSKQIKRNYQLEIDCYEFIPGIYFIALQCGQMQTVRKIIKY